MGDVGDVHHESGLLVADDRVTGRACGRELGPETMAVPGLVPGRETGDQWPANPVADQPHGTGNRPGATDQ